MGDLVNIDDYTKRLTEELKTKFGDRLLDISTSHRELESVCWLLWLLWIGHG